MRSLKDLEPYYQRLLGKENYVARDLRDLIDNADDIAVTAGIAPRPTEYERLQYLLNVVLSGRRLPPPTDTALYGTFCALVMNCFDVFGPQGVIYALTCRHSDTSWARVAAICKFPSRGHINIASDWSKQSFINTGATQCTR